MSDTKRAGSNAESEPLNLRLPHEVAGQLRALADSLPIVSKHRLAVEALRLGIAALTADPSILLRGAATPATIAPATLAAPAPSRAVASPAAPVEPPPVDLRQLPLRAHAAPVIVPHTSASGSSITSAVSNDNGVSPATPKHTRAPSRLDAAAVGERLRALRDDEVARGIAKGSRLWSLRTAGATAGVSPPTIDKLMKGEPVKPEMLAKVAAILPPE